MARSDSSGDRWLLGSETRVVTRIIDGRPVAVKVCPPGIARGVRARGADVRLRTSKRAGYQPPRWDELKPADG